MKTQLFFSYIVALCSFFSISTMQQPVKSQLITFSCLQTDKKNSCCALPITAICLAGDGVQLLGCAAVIAVGKTYFYVDKSFEKWLYSNNNNVKLNKQKAE